MYISVIVSVKKIEKNKMVTSFVTAFQYKIRFMFSSDYIVYIHCKFCIRIVALVDNQFLNKNRYKFISFSE